MTPDISIYPNAIDTTSAEIINFTDFLHGIEFGRWQDDVLRVRCQTNQDAKDAIKKRLPAVTVSGVFSQRNDKSLITHSGFVIIDIDKLENPETLKQTLSQDPYIYAAFVSCGGHGLALIVKIDPKRHRDAFRGFSEYLFTKYNIICDPTSVNPSRLRFVSFDPNLYHNPGAQKFATYPKDKEPKKIQNVLFIQSDFDRIIQQIIERRANLCENYHEWLRIGFGLAHQFNEAGRKAVRFIDNRKNV